MDPPRCSASGRRAPPRRHPVARPAAPDRWKVCGSRASGLEPPHDPDAVALIVSVLEAIGDASHQMDSKPAGTSLLDRARRVHLGSLGGVETFRAEITDAECEGGRAPVERDRDLRFLTAAVFDQVG